jgi:hypothetical protein
MTSLTITTAGLPSTSNEGRYSPLTPMTAGPQQSPSAPSASSDIPLFRSQSSGSSYPVVTPLEYQNVDFGLASRLPHIIFKNKAFKTTDLEYLAQLYNTVIQFGPLYTRTKLENMPPFSALLLDHSDIPTHTWMELNHAGLVDKSKYYTVYLYKLTWGEKTKNAIDATESLLPNAVITKLDPTIVAAQNSAEIWIDSLAKKELPKVVRRGLFGFLQKLGLSL